VIVEARDAIDRVLTFLRRTTAGATIKNRQDVVVTAAGIIRARRTTRARLDGYALRGGGDRLKST
jgi:hypothetical protein